jgi:predicted Zn-dependent protease
MKRAFRVFTAGGIAAILVLTLTSCTTTETGRRQLNLVSSEQEMQLGLTAFDEMKKEVPISKDPAAKALVSRVGTRIAAQATDRLPNAQWEFVVFDSPEANAFCLPGGKVGVYSGLLPIAINEAGLATVIGHEVAHASNHHGAERMSEAMAIQGLGQAVGAATPEKYAQAAVIAFGLGAKVGRELPHSRKQESEADEVGLSYMAKAGYDPEEAVRFWERFAASHKGQSGPPAFLRTHPVDEKRIADLKALMPQAKALYQRAKTSGAAPEAPSGKGKSTPGSTVISK